jgi:hypothetical protein
VTGVFDDDALGPELGMDQEYVIQVGTVKTQCAHIITQSHLVDKSKDKEKKASSTR